VTTFNALHKPGKTLQGPSPPLGIFCYAFFFGLHPGLCFACLSFPLALALALALARS